MNRLRHPLVLVLALLLLRATTAPAQIQPEAGRILHRMLEAYRTAPAFACKGTYVDSDEASPGRPERRTVRMIFSRPERLRLAWTETDSHGKTTTNVIFNRQGKTYFHWESLGRDDHYADLRETIAACAGISLGLSYELPALLLLGPSDDIGFVSLRRLPDARSEDGHACWRLAARTKQGEQREMLIDRKSNALRQLMELTTVEPVTTMQVRAAMAKTDPKMANAPLPPSREVRSTYRFKNIRFTGSWPESAFDL